MAGKILVVARDPNVRKGCAEKVEKAGGECVAAMSLDLAMEDVGHEYCGMIVDSATSIIMTDSERALLADFAEGFPVATVRWDVFREEGSLISAAGASSFETFIRQECAEFIARKLRVFPRIEVQAPVQLSARRGMVAARVTNISEGGAFIETQLLVEMGDLVTIGFDLPDYRTDVPAVVRWRGKGGIGVSFMGLVQGARKELVAKVGECHAI